MEIDILFLLLMLKTKQCLLKFFRFISLNISYNILKACYYRKIAKIKFFIFANLFIVIVVLAIYFNTLNNYFLADTFGFLNINGRESFFDWIRSIFKEGVYLRIIPVFYWNYTYSLFGLNPVWYHLVNVIFHAVNAVLIFYFIFILSKEKYLSFFIAILFAVNPINSETVAWETVSYNIICLNFYLVSLLCFVLFIFRQKIRFYGFSLITFILSLLCKEMALSLPFAIVTYDLIFNHYKNFIRRDDWSKKIRLYLPYFLIFGVYLILRFTPPGKYGGSYGFKINDQLPFYWVFLANGLIKGGLIYLVKMFIMPYKFLLLPINKFIFTKYIILIKISTLLLIVIPTLISVILGFRKGFNKLIAYSFTIIFISTIPFFYLLDSIDRSGGLLNSRYLYFPAVGFSILIAYSFWFFIQRRGISRWIGSGLFFSVLIFYVILLMGNNLAWEKAAEVSYQIPYQTKKIYPLLPHEKIFFYFIPSDDKLSYNDGLYYCQGIQTYINVGLDKSFSIMYGFPVNVYIVDGNRYKQGKVHYGEKNKQMDKILKDFILGNIDPDSYVLRWNSKKNIVEDIEEFKNNGY